MRPSPATAPGPPRAAPSPAGPPPAGAPALQRPASARAIPRARLALAEPETAWPPPRPPRARSGPSAHRARGGSVRSRRNRRAAGHHPSKVGIYPIPKNRIMLSSPRPGGPALGCPAGWGDEHEHIPALHPRVLGAMCTGGPTPAAGGARLRGSQPPPKSRKQRKLAFGSELVAQTPR